MKRPTIIIVLSLVAGIGAACGSGETAADVTRRPVTVTVAPATTAVTAERLETGGTIAALQTAAVSSRIVATIAGVHVTAGDDVRKGDVLVTLDARDTVEYAQQAQAGAVAADKATTQVRNEQRAAEAERQLAAAWHTRIVTLHERNAATAQERDEAEARLTAATARVAATQSAIELADANLAAARSAAAVATVSASYATLRAPFDGQVIERLTDPGNLAAPGIPLLRIESAGARQAIVRVDEARASFVRPGDGVDVEIDAPGVAAGDQKTLTGTVAEVARAIGEDQRAFTVKVNLPATMAARTGTFARVIFRGRARQAVFVPDSAIRRSGQVTSVFVVQDGVARLRLIQVGQGSAHGVEVLAGLDAGEPVVIAPASGVADGIKVVPGGTAAPAGAGR
ncbi:MAG TPA: efflux RND transporter periplasmic adaptor subunit [Vicinamibacterales bacterium]